MPLPSGSWKTVSADGTSWDDDGSDTLEQLTPGGPLTAKAGWILVPAEHDDKDSDWLVLDGGAVRAKTDPERLAELLPGAIETTNDKTRRAIELGFGYGGDVFGLTLEDQANLIDLYARRATLTWPVEVDTIDDLKKVELADQAAGAAYYLAARAAIKTARDAGRAVKDALRAAATVAELEQALANDTRP